MTNNTNIKTTILNAREALNAAQAALNEAKTKAVDFMVDYIKENKRKGGGEGVTVKELAEQTGLNNMTVGTMLSKNSRVYSVTLPITKRYIEVDEEGKAITGEIVERVKRVSGYTCYRWN